MSAAISPLQALGFLLASYAVLGNDALQTLGPFLAANRGRVPKGWQALFLGAVLVAVLLLGWVRGGGDPAWGRLACFALPERFAWPDLIPPLAVLLLTQAGAPVSTSFLVLTAFQGSNLPALLIHSLAGYGVAFLIGSLAYGGAALVRRSVGVGSDREAPAATATPPATRLWLTLQWLATGWLWSQWLIQDLANLYIYLPRHLDGPAMAGSLAVLVVGLCLVVGQNGGAIQGVLASKSATQDPRATTLISSLYGLILFGLARWSPMPLSTTWVFLGLLGGRELALTWAGRDPKAMGLVQTLVPDLLKAGLGLGVSVAVALAVPLLKGSS